MIVWLLVIGTNVLGIHFIWVSWVKDLPDARRKIAGIAILACFAAVSTALPLASASRKSAIFLLEPVPYTNAEGKLYFERSPCTDDCSGHLAGWRRAQMIDMDEKPFCDDMEYTKSFAEGCRAYVRRAYGRWDRITSAFFEGLSRNEEY
jgi:hypothetical protein